MAPTPSKRKHAEFALLSAPERNSISGTVLLAGENMGGMLGLPEHIATRRKAFKNPTMQPFDVVAVKCGGMHSLFLTKDGRVYSCGVNDEGALGREGDEFEPAEVSGLEGVNVVSITAGDSHSAALADDGSVWVWGCYRDSNGKLGFPGGALVQKTAACIIPAPKKPSEKIIKLVSGTEHTLALQADGTVLSWGCPENGQTGKFAARINIRGRKEKELTPGPVTFGKQKGVRGQRAVDIFAGGYHSFALLDNGNVIGFGLNNHGQLALDADEVQFTMFPTVCKTIADLKPKTIACGQHHTTILTESGRVFALGRGDYGRLGTGNEEHAHAGGPVPVTVPPGSKVVKLHAGTAQTFMIDSDGKGWACGFGENYQLSNGDDEDRKTFTEIVSPHLEGRKVIDISCGAQHTAVLATKLTSDKEGKPTPSKTPTK
eukprot:Clim_evm30s199 gene=Clim_evmTU30s199